MKTNNLKRSKKLRFLFAIPKTIPIFAMPNHIMVSPYRRESGRRSIRNWAFFMSIDVILLMLGGRFHIRNLRLSFLDLYMLFGGYYNVVWRLRETDSRFCIQRI